MNLKKNQIAKKACAEATMQFIKSGMTIGLGTGSTATYFIELLGKLVTQGLKISAVATSLESHNLAKSLGISMIDINKVKTLDLCVDGADEIDSQKQMIKGGGSALFREKIIANMSEEMIVLVDQSKVVDYLGKFPLPVEITRFGHSITMREIAKFGTSASLRMNKDDSPLITDNDNYIVDLKLEYPCKNPSEEHLKIKLIPGVCETGLFINMAGRVIIGYDDGHVEIR